MGTFPVQRINPVEAYPSAFSVRPGGALDFHVSVANPQPGELVRLEVFHHSQVRFDSRRFQETFSAIDVYKEDYRDAIAIDPGQAPLYRASFPGVKLDVPVYPEPGTGELLDASRGCAWEVAHRLSPVPAEWKSGVYLARFLYAPAITYVLFVVRPAAPANRRAKILCSLATHTYQAYNGWNDACFYDDLPPGTKLAAKVSFDRPCHLWKFILFDQNFVAWLERGFDADYCTSADLHADPTVLDGYNLFISVGHDEYWTGEMRDRVESFVDKGGNATFLTGNTCYWQVRLEDDDRTLVCYKDVDLDGKKNPEIPASRRTGKWYEPPVSRPTSAMTGLNFRNGGAITDKARPAVGFTVTRSGSWVFAGTALADGDTFGQEDAIVGYECDAMDFDSPCEFITLATVQVDDRWTGNQDGREGTMGMFRKGRGCVVSAGTTGWGQGLRDPAGQTKTSRITRNIVERLQAPIARALYGVTKQGELLWYEDWLQDGTGGLAGPRTIGRGGWDSLKLVFSGREGVVYAISGQGDLLFYKDPSEDGTADIVELGTIGVGGWDQLAHVTAGAGGVLYALTGAGELRWYKDRNRDGTGAVAEPQVIGRGLGPFLFFTAADDGVIYAVTADGNLLWYKDATGDGTGQVAGPQVIGRGGWNQFQRVVAGDHGVVYAITADGNLLWYRDIVRDGSADITGPLHVGSRRFVALA
jgi:hypothetical protein